MKLLTRGNPKTLKGEKKGYLTYIMHLAPADMSGYNVCAMATDGCIAACLNTAGHGGIGAGSLAEIKGETQTNTVQKCRIRRTKWYFEDRPAFMAALHKEIKGAIRYAQARDLTPVFRLNGTSDIPWESVPVIVGNHSYTNIMYAFPHIQFYDYTKRPNRKNLPPNYHITFSYAETTRNQNDAIKAVANGMNVAVVFRSRALVESYLAKGTWEMCAPFGVNMPVFDGDESDLRFLDPAGVAVALYAKGRGKRDKSGFVQD
jgi:hypothetical protein